MDIRYKRELNHTWMMMDMEISQDSYVRRILMEEKPAHLLPVQFFYRDEEKEIRFDITGCHSLEDLLEKRPMKFEELRILFQGLSCALKEMEDCLLEEDHLILDPACIYALPDFSGIRFCCHPDSQKEFFPQLESLVQYCLNKIDHQDARGVEAAYELFRISGSGFYRFEDLMQVIGHVQFEEKTGRTEMTSPGTLSDYEIPEETRIPEKQTRAKSNVLSVLLLLGGIILLLLCGYIYVRDGYFDWRYALGALAILLSVLIRLRDSRKKQAEENHWKKAEEAREPASVRGTDRKTTRREETELSFGYKTGFPPKTDAAEGETVILSVEGDYWHGLHRLIPEDDDFSPEIRINKTPFIIGKSLGEADAGVYQETVSRVHACIEYQDESCRIKDCHSTNGTYVNGVRLLPDAWYPLKTGDEIILADVKYHYE